MSGIIPNRILPAILLVAAALFPVISCDKLTEELETGKYYTVSSDGCRYFVWLDNFDGESAEGHYYFAGAVNGSSEKGKRTGKTTGKESQRAKKTGKGSPGAEDYSRNGESQDATAPRHDFNARLNRRTITITSDEGTARYKKAGVKYAQYEEPPYAEGDLSLFREPYCKVAETHDIKYGKAQGYWTSLEGVEQDVFKIFSKGYLKSFRKRKLDLTLDLYQPEGLEGNKPLIMFIHGGAFYIGSKDEPAYVDFCKHFASMGYITASINYRLGFHASKNEIERAGYVALQDAHAAMRHLAANARKYGIDTARIFVAGSSAGSITALNLAFMKDDGRPESTRGKKAFLKNKADLGPMDSSGNNIKEVFSIDAIANMWGAVSDPDILRNGSSSIVSFHGDCDNLVPYGEGYPLAIAGEGLSKMLGEEMSGSSCIDSKAGEIGLRHHLYTFHGEGHALNTGKDKQPNANHTFIKDRIAEFFFEEMVPEQAGICESAPGCYTVTGHNISDVQWKVEGGFILSTPSPESICILWCADKAHSLTAAGDYGSDIDWIATLKQ